jgi:hypothetical protein
MELLYGLACALVKILQCYSNVLDGLKIKKKLECSSNVLDSTKK